MFAETLLYLQAVKTLESHNVRHNYSKIPMLYMLWIFSKAGTWIAHMKKYMFGVQFFIKVNLLLGI